MSRLAKAITPVRLIIVLMSFVIIAFVGVTLIRYTSVAIPVVTQPVPAGTTITADLVGSHEFPGNGIFPALITSPQNVIGKVAAVNLLPYQPIAANYLTDPHSVTGVSNTPADPRFPAAVADDLFKYKIYVPVDLRRSGGGVISPGDYVNVMQINGPGQATTILQKIHVVRALSADGYDINPATSVGPVKPPGGLVIALTPDQAALVISQDPNSLWFIYTSLSAPDLSGVPTGAPRVVGTSAPSASPTIAPPPVNLPGVSKTAAPSLGGQPVVTPAPIGTPSPTR